MVMTCSRAKVQGQQLISSEDRVQHTDGQTDGGDRITSLANVVGETHTHSRLMAFFARTTWVVICTSLQEIIMPAPYHSNFYGPDALPAAQPTA